MAFFSKRKWWKISLLVLGLAFCCGLAAGAALALLGDMPEIVKLENWQSSGISKIFDRHGKLLFELSQQRRKFIPLEDIPQPLQQAVLVTEDARFFGHSGIDPEGIVRAIIKDIIKLRFAEGASTITQQLSRVLFLTTEKSIARKLKEAILAIQIERKYTKKQILELYLNQIYYGSGAYGVEKASETFFDKQLNDLSLLEYCIIAGIPQNPARYNPFRHPQRALQRGRLILRKLLRSDKITIEKYDLALEEEVKFINGHWRRGQTTHLEQMVVTELLHKFGANQVYKGQLSVFTTIDKELQETALAAVDNGLEKYQQRHPKNKDNDLVEGALYARKVKSGEIVALVGGRDFSASKFNRAIQAKRQPGSAFKPIVFSKALEQGYNQSSIVGDFPLRYSDGKGGLYQPTNYDNQFLGYLTLRQSLAKSRNTISVKLASKVGMNSIISLARNLGIESKIEHNLTSALGSSSLSLAELVSAYATFANGGVRVSPLLIKEVLDRHGKSVWQQRISAVKALNKKTAFLITDMLHGVIENGTGRAAAELPCFLAGKTGTTDDYRDAMFVGFSSDIAAAVWVGYDDNRSLGHGETGGRAALPIWKKFFRKHCQRDRPPTFSIPQGIVLRQVEKESGLLYRPGCKEQIQVAFLRGQEPELYCGEGIDLSQLAKH